MEPVGQNDPVLRAQSLFSISPDRDFLLKATFKLQIIGPARWDGFAILL